MAKVKYTRYFFTDKGRKLPYSGALSKLKGTKLTKDELGFLLDLREELSFNHETFLLDYDLHFKGGTAQDLIKKFIKEGLIYSDTRSF